MRRLLLPFVFLFSSFLLGTNFLYRKRTTAAVPPLVKFSGTLANTQGTVGVIFALYTDQTGGAPLWLETQNVTPGCEWTVHGLSWREPRQRRAAGCFCLGGSALVGRAAGRPGRTGAGAVSERALCLEGGGRHDAGRAAVIGICAGLERGHHDGHREQRNDGERRQRRAGLGFTTDSVESR